MQEPEVFQPTVLTAFECCLLHFSLVDGLPFHHQLSILAVKLALLCVLFEQRAERIFGRLDDD
jgi:hypothetical protein